MNVRSLVIAPQWIGDAIMAEPLLRALHAGGQTLTVAALPWVAPVFGAMAGIDRVLELPFAHGGLQWRARRLLAKQWQGGFDRAYVLPNSFKSALLPWWAGIPERIGYHGEARWGVLTRRLANPKPGVRLPMVDFYRALAGLGQAPDARPCMALAPQQTRATLQALQLVDQAYWVLAPGAEYGAAKRWPVAHAAELVRLADAPVVLLGSAKDAPVCDAIVAQSGVAHCRSLAGQTRLEQAMAVIAGAQVVVSNDSGLMHVAAALGVPQVALFGSSSPLHTPPLNDQAAVLWLKQDPHYSPALDCAPCFQRDCRYGHTRCLHDLLPQRVLQAAQAMGKKKPPFRAASEKSR